MENTPNKMDIENDDDDNSLASIIYKKLENKDYHGAHNEIRRKKYRKYLTNNSMEIVPKLTRTINEEFCTQDTERCIENLLTYIAGIANAKEVTLVLLEETEIFKSEKIFRIMLKPLQHVLLKKVSTNEKLTIFSWVFKTIHSHIVVLPLPQNYDLEGDERKLLECDPDYQILTNHLRDIFTFYSNICDKVATEELVWVDVDSSKECLGFVLLKYFDRPLSYLDIFEQVNGGSSIFRIVQKYVSIVRILLSNPFKLLKYIDTPSLHSKDTDNEEDSEDADTESNNNVDIVLSIATYYYCIFSQKMELENIPLVYDPEFIYLSCIPCYLRLLSRDKYLAIHKGLLLLESLLLRLTSKLDSSTLEYKDHYKIPESLINIMVLCDSKELRSFSLSIFKLFLNNFDCNGKYMLTSKLLITITHSGIRGVIIQYIKQIIVDILNKGQKFAPSFSGKSLQRLLLQVCFLPKGEMTDLLENSDAIMEALNFILYLTLKDTRDELMIRPVLREIYEKFLKPLLKGLQLSKAHYKLKLNEIKNSKRRNGNHEVKMTVSVGSDTLPELTRNEELKVINHALNYFDVIESVWARVDKSVLLCIKSQ